MAFDNVKVSEFLEALGMYEEPYGVYYSDEAPADAIMPKAGSLPSVEDEARGLVDWKALNDNFTCVIGVLWRARKKKVPACFDRDHFGCLGGAFYLGYLKPQLEAIVHYVSTGVPNRMEGEHYLESPDAMRSFLKTIDPQPATRRFCVMKPVSQFTDTERPEIVVFFARPESISGLNQMSTYVTNDFEATMSPFGAGCSNILTWPLKYLAEGKLKAVLGGWDPSERKYLKPDELTLAMPTEMFDRMVYRWRDSFLSKEAWTHVKKKIEKSRTAWGETDTQ